MNNFMLDQRLAADTIFITDTSLCHVLLMNNQLYPWVILVPQVANISEVFQLSTEQQQQLWQEATHIAQIMKKHFKADKMNMATLGNVVAQLHLHIIARFEGDTTWPAPVWGGPSKPHTKKSLTDLIPKLKTLIEKQLHTSNSG